MSTRYPVYYDVYEQQHFGAASTTDFVHWADETARVRFPENARHGTRGTRPPRLRRRDRLSGVGEATCLSTDV